MPVDLAVYCDGNSKVLILRGYYFKKLKSKTKDKNWDREKI